ncbi:MAG: 3'-5' exonuclease [Alyxoria varia]|nr:MAG: 3'-5' exonuclease [Alyxoria varia]
MASESPNLSSNWKALQKQLKEQQLQTSSSATSSKKRKATILDVPGHTDPAKKRNRKSYHTTVSRKPNAKPKSRAMGSAVSYFGASTDDTNEANNDLPRDVPKNNKKLNGTQQATSTTDIDPSGRSGKYVALDTEMVGTLNPPPFSLPPSRQPPYTSSILARASLVSYTGEVLYDAYVLPPPAARPIADYRTQWSGITPWHLNPKNPITCPKDFDTVQKEVADLLEGRVLIGHDVKNDLAVLGLGHPISCIRDTANHPRFRVQTTVQAGRREGGDGRAMNSVDAKTGRGRVKGKKPSLKTLAEEVLGLEIQSDEKKGHSSVEDAKAVMALFRQEKVHFERIAHEKFGKSAGGGRKGKGSAVLQPKAALAQEGHGGCLDALGNGKPSEGEVNGGSAVDSPSAVADGVSEAEDQAGLSGSESANSLDIHSKSPRRTSALKKRKRKGKKKSKTKRQY